MRLGLGILVVIASVLGGYIAMGGHLEVLVQPFEAVIILGAAMGAYIIGNTGPVLKQSIGVFGTLARGLALQQSFLRRTARPSVQPVQAGKGPWPAGPRTAYRRPPRNSTIFQRFPKFASNHHAVEFMCDYLRMVTLGTNNVHELEALMDEELETHHQENARLVTRRPDAGRRYAGPRHRRRRSRRDQNDGLDRRTPEVLGHMIGGALVGTFLGVFVAYGFFGPMARALRNIYEAEAKYFLSMKTGLLAHISGYGAGNGDRVRPQDADERRPPDLHRNRRGDRRTGHCDLSTDGRAPARQPIIIKKVRKGARTPITAAPGRSPTPTS